MQGIVTSPLTVTVISQDGPLLLAGGGAAELLVVGFTLLDATGAVLLAGGLALDEVTGGIVLLEGVGGFTLLDATGGVVLLEGLTLEEGFTLDDGVTLDEFEQTGSVAFGPLNIDAPSAINSINSASVL